MRTSDCLPHQVLETKRTLDGGLRAAISLEMQPRVRHGWMTLIMTDGKEQVTYVTPQPPLELPPVKSKAAPCWAPSKMDKQFSRDDLRNCMGKRW